MKGSLRPLGLSLCIATVVLASSWTFAQPPLPNLAALQQAITQADALETQGLNLNLPLVAEDGSAVPLKVQFNAPLAEGEWITQLRVFASGNPNAEVIDFEPSAAISQLEFSSRIRLSESQDVYVLASSNQGRQWLASRQVRVTLSGCLMSGDEDTTQMGMSQPRIALPRQAQAGKPAEIRTLINHPMETGFRETASGETLAASLVDHLVISRAGETLLRVKFYTGTSANPFVSFFLDQQDQLTFTWTDDQGQQIQETR
ncbi:thiosulfate oxidation carrier protein SoxY [Nitrincola tapanii]|uniref:Thiosulfate oxidation carrier complex protein SoxZ n=1 Tax=Nitrincola tapanii TaxID=1708751 RepID=A0A5A9W4P8_9GAMM|nr:thiosulfate oxidation carrier protein SoxY [Nitrincola tapanii]KAA0875048.1 thiosulfate oxidation carrier complex protein SoxZ [Nitrincola tapanii]